MSLYHTFRPKTFNDFVGNTKEVSLLKKMMGSPDHPHSFIFHGPTGCGKTSMARVIGEMLTDKSSIMEYNSADDRGIDTVRELYDLIQYPPIIGNNLVIILDEFHMGTKEGQNALLKLLEDYPPYVYIFICTTDPEKLIPAIHSRCTKIAFNSVSTDDIYILLRRIKKEAKLVVSPDVLNAIAEASQGFPRHAIVLLESVSNIEDEESQMIFLKNTELFDEKAEVIELCRAIYNSRPWAEVSTVIEKLKKNKEEPERIRRAILGYLSSTILGKVDDYTADRMTCFTDNLFNTGFPGLVLQCYKACYLARGKGNRLENIL